MRFRESQHTNEKRSRVTRVTSLTCSNLSVAHAGMLLQLSIDIRYLLKFNKEIWREYIKVQNRRYYGGSGLNKNQIKGIKNMDEDYITSKTLGLCHPYIYRVITPLDLSNPLANPQKNPFSLSKARFN